MCSQFPLAVFAALSLPSSVFAQTLPDEIHIDVEGAAEIDLEPNFAACVEEGALQAALATATARAERLAKAAGRKLGRVYPISGFRLREDRWGVRTGA